MLQFSISVTFKIISLSTCYNCSQVNNIKFSIVSSFTSQSLSKFYSFSINGNTCAETESKLIIISYIWDDDHIHWVDENNWQLLWRNTSFQGTNDT